MLPSELGEVLAVFFPKLTMLAIDDRRGAGVPYGGIHRAQGCNFYGEARRDLVPPPSARHALEVASANILKLVERLPMWVGTPTTIASVSSSAAHSRGIRDAPPLQRSNRRQLRTRPRGSIPPRPIKIQEIAEFSGPTIDLWVHRYYAREELLRVQRRLKT